MTDDDPWAPQSVRYCDDGVEYARGTPIELAGQVKALKVENAKLKELLAEALASFGIPPKAFAERKAENRRILDKVNKAGF
jgi:hypothetical protein